MPKRVARSLYHRILRLVSAADRCPSLHAVASQRWAEYLPPCLVLENPKEPLAHTARRCFDSDSGDIGAGFAFLRESSSTFYLVHLLSMWESVRSRGDYDLMESLGILSAARQVSQLPDPSADGLASAAKDYAVFGRHFVRSLMARVEDRLSGMDAAEKLTAECIGEIINIVREEASLTRAEATADDFCLISMALHQKASENVLNIMLFTVLRMLKVRCVFCGATLPHQWIRVSLPGSQPVFVSWSYGALLLEEVEATLPPTGAARSRRWTRGLKWDAECRRHVLCFLLSRQMLLLSSSTETTNPSIIACKEQLLFLSAL